ncbi:MAG: FAD-dependent oxidoreductase, partial [Gemmatimonadaceae bacterium]
MPRRLTSDDASPVTRRECLQRLIVPAAAAAFGLSACAKGAPPYLVERTVGRGRTRRFVPVAVEPGRVIRSSVGLRPYRPSGFRLESENLQGKQLVHLYGHGGGGMTLSWGTANMAVTMLTGQGAGAAAAVIGAGVVGLSTGILLQRQGFAVTIYTASMPPHTTSNASAATFFPSHVIDRDKVTPEFTGRLETALRTSYHAYQRLVGPRYGVRWLDSYSLGSGQAPSGEPEVESRLQEKVVATPNARLERGTHPFDAPSVSMGRDLVIEPFIYLRALLDDFRMAGGTIVVQHFASLRDLAQLRERVVFNCTGLGSRTLVGDTELKPASGQLAVLPPQPDVDYTLYHGPFYYMVPRQDGIILGGTFDLGNESSA